MCFDKRNDIKYPDWVIGKKLYQRISKRLLCIVTGGRKKTFSIFKKKRPVKDLYYGSSWWCLPCDCVEEMMSILESNDRYTEYYSTSICPDESFIHTLFMQTKYAGTQKGNLTYIDWSAGQSSPKTLKQDDFEKLISLDDKYLFARKMDFDTDYALLSLLKSYIGIK